METGLVEPVMAQQHDAAAVPGESVAAMETGLVEPVMGAGVAARVA